MDVLFVGKFFTRTLLKDVIEKSNGKIGFSNHNFERSLISGLTNHKQINLTCVSVPAVYSYPYNNSSIYTKSESYREGNCKVESIGFCNLLIVNKVWSAVALFIKLKDLIKLKEKSDIIVNTPSFFLLLPIILLRAFNKSKTTLTVIIPDVPVMITSMDKQNFIKKVLLRFLDSTSIKLASRSDHLVLLTEAMNDFFKRPIDHIVMEGLVDLESMSQRVAESVNKRDIILYTGTLRKIFGVMNLVNAFTKLTEQNIQLWICGSGECAEDIEEASRKDPRIVFKGLVDSQTALAYQNQATILVNPRTSYGEYTKYSFPSKLLEYLLSGKSVIANRLPGIPKEYDDYIYFPKDESVESLTETIKYVLSLPKEVRHYKGYAGRTFVINNKNSVVQTGRILEMINKGK